MIYFTNNPNVINAIPNIKNNLNCILLSMAPGNKLGGYNNITKFILVANSILQVAGNTVGTGVRYTDPAVANSIYENPDFDRDFMNCIDSDIDLCVIGDYDNKKNRLMDMLINIESYRDIDFILYIGRSDCGDCIEFHPILEKYLQEHSNLGVYYLDVKEFRDKANSENATQEEKDFFKNIYTTLDFDWTPTLQHRRGKQVLSKITYLSMDYYEIEDQTQQEETKQENIQEIYTWLEKECE